MSGFKIHNHQQPHFITFMAMAGFISTAADVTSTALLFYKAELTGDSNSEAFAMLAETGAGIIGSKAANNIASDAVRETSEAIAGPAFRSGFTGRFISNFHGATLKYGSAAVGGTAAAVGVALFNTIFE